MIAIILITTAFLLINGIPYITMYLGRGPWERRLALFALSFLLYILPGITRGANP